MSFWRRLFEGRASAESGYWVYVCCQACGEPLKTRVDLDHDLSAQYGATETETTFFCRKTLIGSGPCFAPVQVELTFDHRRRLLHRQIHGGRFLTEDEYQALLAERGKAAAG